jgi:hypothetical protein
MTNLEFYKDEIKKKIKNGENFACAICQVKNKNCQQCSADDGDDILCDFVDWLLEEHKEKIKLTEFENDVLKAFTKYPTYVDDDIIDNYIALQDLSSAGWFQNVDENLSIKEILENCEVIDK